MTTPKEVLALARVPAPRSWTGFSDLPGLMQHFSIPAGELSEESFEDGLGFDGSSIRGFQEIQESDMLLVPDPETAYLDPFTRHTTLNLRCFVKDPVTGEMYSRDPRQVARKAELYLQQTGIADTSFWGPECEFYIFDSVRFDQNQHEGYYHLDAIEGVWNSGREREIGGEPNLGYKPRYKEGYFPLPPADHYQDLRSEMLLKLEQVGLSIEVHHHEVGTAGQAEIDMRYSTLLATADNVMKYKYVVKNTARQAGKTVTFMPKPLFQDNGSGMHAPEPVEGRREPVLGRGRLRGDLGHRALYIGGLIAHAPSLLALPTTHELDRRLVPGYEAPINLVYSQRNRSACVRIPQYFKNRREAARVPQDPSCNPYLAFAAMLMAGLDGVKSKIEPPEPIDKDLYDLPPEELSVKQVPARSRRCSTRSRPTTSGCSRAECSRRT